MHRREEAMTNRPPTISIKQIASAVDKAVKIASDKHGVKFGPEFTINPGLIMGRWLLEDVKLSQAGLIANEIAQHAAGTGLGGEAQAAVRPPLNPVVLGIGGHVICGFWPGPEWTVRE
jgi:hypothetical protein